MDDLLALMDSEDVEAPTHQQQGNVNRCNSSHADDTTPSNTRRSSTKQGGQDPVNQTIKEKNHQNSKSHAAEAGVDDRVGIRMLKRRVSSSDLTDLLETYSYHSTAALSAMSLAALNRLLTDPAVIVDAVTVGGTMEIITVGIVFTNSGTRIASSGSAFCTLSIGNLNTGPCATVLLFGEAYSSACRSCVPGRVIALLMPRLVPPKDKQGGPSSTSITFSINTKDQLIVLADARDYGTCRATVSCRGGFRMPHQGDSLSDGVAKLCKNYVDKRIGEYCTVHRKMALVKNSNSDNNGAMNKSGVSSKGLTQMQRLRQEQQGHRMQIPSAPLNQLLHKTQIPLVAPPRNGNINIAMNKGPVILHQPHITGTHSKNSILNASTNRNAVPTANLAKGNMHVRNNGGNLHGIPFSIGMTCGSNIPNQRTVTPQPLPAPKHMTKQTSALHTNQEQHSDTSIVNRGLLHPNLLKEGTKRWNPLVPSTGNAVDKKQRRSVNTDKAGFDGSVPVPKPNKLFGGKRSFHQVCPAVTASHINMSEAPSNRDAAIAAEVKEKQKQLASILQESETATKPTKSSKLLGAKQKSAKSNSQSISEASFGADVDLDYEKLMSAKSRFANEIDAEEYVKSRRIVSELEQKEEAKSKKDQAKPSIEPAIAKQYYCTICDRNFPYKPDGCIRAGHKIILDRSVKEKESVEQKRTEITNKAVEDGGLRLGAGLEWSGRYSRFS